MIQEDTARQIFLMLSHGRSIEDACNRFILSRKAVYGVAEDRDFIGKAVSERVFDKVKEKLEN